jgi:hypothetical protein
MKVNNIDLLGYLIEIKILLIFNMKIYICQLLKIRFLIIKKTIPNIHYIILMINSLLIMYIVLNQSS